MVGNSFCTCSGGRAEGLLAESRAWGREWPHGAAGSTDGECLALGGKEGPGGCRLLSQLCLPRDLCAAEDELCMSPQAKHGQGLGSPRWDLTFSQLLLQNCQIEALTALRDCTPVRFRK